MSKIIESISDIISLYDVFILDQWGVMHDGNKGYDCAITVSYTHLTLPTILLV